jgi:cell division protein ZapA (FtsZ GTPase activity inhibitor)
MAEMSNNPSGEDRVQVQIGGRSYTLRGNRNPEAVRKVAAFVDQKMNEIAARSSTADTTRLAILAALNIASDLFTRGKNPVAGGKADPSTCGHEQRDQELCRILDSALSG